MTVSVENEKVVLRGACTAEEAEALLQHLLTMNEPVVDWRGCDAAHGAVVQLLLNLPPEKLEGPPRGRFLREFVAPALEAAARTRAFLARP